MNNLPYEINPLFSVVIPAFNREKVIKRAIDSVMNQTIDNYEIIVVDDGSKDHTVDVVKGYKDERVKYVRQDNAGACVARNTGIEKSQGLYVSFLDSDDEWYPQMLEKQLEQYLADSEIGCVYSNLSIVNSKGKAKPFGKQFGIQGRCYKEVLQQGYMAPTSVLSAKRECFKKVGVFDINLPASQDDDMCFKLAKYYKVGYIPEVMATMYVEQVNRISNNPKRVADGWWKLWNKYEEDVVSLCGKAIMRDYYGKCMLRYASINETCLYEQSSQKYIEYGGKIGLVKGMSHKLLGSFLYPLKNKFLGLMYRLFH